MIDVLLATYRPDPALLEAQVKSVHAQRGVEINLIQREDQDGLGPSGNFNELLKLSKSEYLAFCDQDDVWREDKLQKELAEIRRLETEYGNECPLLVFCDSEVVDAELHSTGETNFSRQGVNVEVGLRINRLAMQNFIPGHTMLINAALRKLAGEIPSAAIMYDYWIALVAAAFGKIGFVDESLVLYRQHNLNSLGSGRRSSGIGEFRRRVDANVKQAKAFEARFGGDTPPPLVALSKFDEYRWFGRRRLIIRHGLYKHGFFRNLMLFGFS